MNFIERFLRRCKYKWEPRPKLPRAERVSVLDDIVHSDWYEPRKKLHENQHKKQPPGENKV